MRWIKIHGNMLSDDRLQHVLDEQRFAGIGLYLFLLQLVECQGEGAIALSQVIGALERRYSRKKIMRYIQEYDLFVLSEDDFSLDETETTDATEATTEAVSEVSDTEEAATEAETNA